MKHFDWDEKKNAKLKLEREIGFEDVVTAIHEGDLLVTLNHPNKERYPNQKIYIVNIENYAYVVPFIETEGKKILKTIYPSRKMTKKYIIGKEKI